MDFWVESSSLATGVLVEVNGAMIEDACWLRSEIGSQHINLAELGAVIKGINQALQWLFFHPNHKMNGGRTRWGILSVSKARNINALQDSKWTT